MQTFKIEPLIIVIFGASGDLARRKLIPAIYDLFSRGLLPKNFALLGVGRTKYTDDQFRQESFLGNNFLDNPAGTEDAGSDFSNHLFYQALDTSDVAQYELLKSRLDQLDQNFNTKGNCIFYLSTPPSLYGTIPAALAAHGLHQHPSGFRRLVIEKPFGYDLVSAVKLNRTLRGYFLEDNIFRIDHYLGKETVQNLLVTRFSNGIFEPLWNRNYIQHIEITSAEDIGVEGRGGYYDSSGAMRDMLQNHLLQLVALVAMEPPIAPTATAIRSEKNKLFQSMMEVPSAQVRQVAIRGQYLQSHIRGKVVRGYREEPGVDEKSRTETFAALKFSIENWRWSGVPFYIRTGKRLPTRVAEITITFRKPPQRLFRSETDLMNQANNQLVIRIQPDEGLLLNFAVKKPGDSFLASNVGMDFRYSELGDADIPEAYERLLLDCIKGDSTLFAHGESVELSWRFIDPILQAWQHDPEIPIYGYPAGSWGPIEADGLIEDTDLKWRNPCRRLTSDTNFCEL